jgi:phosphoribosylformimino-5-aminoimidazole carboxamide ribotide isomerase
VILFPAIDIRGGRCVRLVEGDYARETIFRDDPSAVAEEWRGQGAEWIHLVDLDGARAGRPQNVDEILEVRRRVDCHLQVGGGIRNEADADRYLAAGIDRVVLGTVAIFDPELVRTLADQCGDRIAVGLDARNGKLAGSGWLVQTEASAAATALELRDAGITTFIYTDIARDGTLTGPNLQEIQGMVEVLGEGVIASGGVSQMSDIEAIRATGATGAVVGRALYDGRIRLDAALAVLRSETQA